jgi:hypothetical protein
MNANMRIHGEDERADVQRCALGGRNPVFINQHQLTHGFERKVLIDLGDAQAFVGHIQPCHIAVGAEHKNVAVFGPIGLEPLKNLLPVVQTHIADGSSAMGP